MPAIAINVVMYNGASTIDACLQSVLDQDFTDFVVTVVDNASTDDSVTRAQKWQDPRMTVLRNEKNLYYARAHNRAIAATDSEFVLTLNPDAVLYPDYVSRVLTAFRRSPRIGSVNGKLLLVGPDQFGSYLVRTPPSVADLIDGAGLMLRRSRRPHLRGNRMPSATHCLESQYIFGADGACATYRRAMLEDVAIGEEYFDEDFAIYREDVDLAWRAQWLGWDTYYCPDAVGYHVRGFHIGRGRRHISAELKRQSVKNGWLLMVKNDTVPAFLVDLPWILPYQMKVLGGILLLERGSLVAVRDTWELLPKMLEKRRVTQTRRRRRGAEVRRRMR